MRRTYLALTALAAFLVTSPAAAQDPYSKADDTWISISGTISSVTKDRFTLDYGEGFVTVEMDDWDPQSETYGLDTGDTVTVNGIVDDGLFEMRSIEASSVYVENLDRYFFASPADEEGTFIGLRSPILVSSATLQGRVTEVGDDEFTIETGYSDVTVATSELGYDPLDDMGYQKIEVGDRVSATGTLYPDFFEGRRMVADLVVTLNKADSTS